MSNGAQMHSKTVHTLVCLSSSTHIHFLRRTPKPCISWRPSGPLLGVVFELEARGLVLHCYSVRTMRLNGWSRLSCSPLRDHNLTFLNLHAPSYRQTCFAHPSILVPIVLGNILSTATSNVRILGHHYLLGTDHRQATFISFKSCDKPSRVVYPFRLP
jgi:hypothetical protein